jgi:hypothetical protein
VVQWGVQRGESCDDIARVWLLKRQVIEMLGAREARLRFQVIDERVLPDETAGDSLKTTTWAQHGTSSTRIRSS